MPAHPAEREVRDEDDPLRPAVVDDLVVGAVGEAEAVLYCRDGHDPAGALDLVDGHVGDADTSDLAALVRVPDRAEALLEARGGIGSVQVVEADAVGPQPPQALVDLLPQHIGPRAVPPALRGDEVAV